MNNIPELFGCMVFNDSVMRERLPKDTYKLLKKTITDGRTLDPSIANIIAAAMKDWATQKGATHYTHWFQPMTGITAEKHESFISPTFNDGVIMEFSGKELTKGEPDASSFPSGGLRATFEARGYTAWDPSSYAFIKDETLYIPTAFCSYGGEALDKKTPLLRSMEALDRQGLRILQIFGTPASRVLPSVGAEQEYFLIDEKMYEERKDLKYTGRTLFGARPPKGQELDDHYYGAIKDRVKEFMRDLDLELWQLGILAKTEHNEAAPAQHELAPIYTTANVSTDQNQLIMDMMKKVAKQHGLVCLLHEKPFAGVNGSGKHNNWSLVTDTGINLLDPGKSPKDNAQFLLMLCAVIKAVDEHQDLLRISVCGAGNDHRLGASEAPPAIVSVFIGDDLFDILKAIETDTLYAGKGREELEIGVHILPHFRRDTTDRNRTSPFAFTGNKFEFRMPGSSASIASPNVVLNTTVAESLRQYADEIEESLSSGGELNETLERTIKRTVAEHKRIIFNGNNYSPEWSKEAAKRGLLNLPTTTDALKTFITPENEELFTRHGVFSPAEMRSRRDIYYENYRKTVKIEGYTMLDMVNKDIMPAAIRYCRTLSESMNAQRDADPALSCRAEHETLKRLSALTDELYTLRDELRSELVATQNYTVISEKAEYYSHSVVPAMKALREVADEIETLLPEENLPYPTYGKLLFGVN